jgi:hypothetical protein
MAVRVVKSFGNSRYESDKLTAFLQLVAVIATNAPNLRIIGRTNSTPKNADAPKAYRTDCTINRPDDDWSGLRVDGLYQWWWWLLLLLHAAMVHTDM